MLRHRLTRSAAITALAASLLLAGTLPALAVGGTDDYPTWDEVQAAQGSEAAKQAESERLREALDRTRTDAAAAASRAADAHSAARQAEEARDAAAAREVALQQKVDQAQHDLGANDEALGRMVSWLYTNGTGLASASALATSQNPEEFMSKFSMSTQVSGTWNGIAERAQAEVNSAATLREQADAARAERERLSAEAVAATAAATDAQQQADAAVTTATQRNDTVYAQLAALRGTTADVERRYEVGVQVAEQAREQERQREEAARQQEEAGGGSGGGASGGGSGGGNGGSGGGGVIVDPAGAQAYARSVLGAYGWGDDQFSCLVSLWTGESDWRADALNPWSGAYGIPQSLPAEKMATAGPDWRTNGRTQVDWGLAYIQSSYGSPCSAWNTWQSRNPHWY